MKALKRCLVAGMLAGLAVLSTALAGSAYAGIAAPRERIEPALPEFVAEGSERAFTCVVGDDQRIRDCAPSE